MKKIIEKIVRRIIPKGKNHETRFDDSFVFISKDRDVFVGEEAKKMIDEKKENKNFRNGIGVVSVDEERWREAQLFEEKTWINHEPNAKEDGNSSYISHFDFYKHISSRKFKRAIELGCGPFTNIRHIAEFLDVDEIHLLDPLVEKYKNHKNCSYKNNELKIKKKLFIKKKKVFIHQSSIEEFNTQDRFDLVVMINVIEHCFDLQKIFDKIMSIMEKDGVFIFYDKYFSSDDINRNIEKKYDAGHPLRVSGQLLDEFIFKNFKTLLYKRNLFSLIKRDMKIEYTGLYFIGEKL